MPVLVETVSVEMDLVTSSVLHSEVTSDTGCILVPWSTHLVQSRRKVKHVISKYINIYIYTHIFTCLLGPSCHRKEHKARVSGVEGLPRSFGNVESIITYCKLHMWGVLKETLSVELHSDIGHLKILVHKNHEIIAHSENPHETNNIKRNVIWVSFMAQEVNPVLEFKQRIDFVAYPFPVLLCFRWTYLVISWSRQRVSQSCWDCSSSIDICSRDGMIPNLQTATNRFMNTSV